jgi:hypothetical protein
VYMLAFLMTRVAACCFAVKVDVKDTNNRTDNRKIRIDLLKCIFIFEPLLSETGNRYLTS